MNNEPPIIASPTVDQSSEPHSSKKAALIAQAMVLPLLVFLAYWPSLRGGFVWDDLVLVVKNPLTTGALNLRTVWLGTDFSLSTVVTWFEWLVFGKNPTGYRVVNALLHGISALLLWRVLIRLKIPGAWLGAALFAVHPVAVASVAWISELKNTLSLPFCLLSFWAYLAFQQRLLSPSLSSIPNGGEGGRRPGEEALRFMGGARRFYLLSLVAFLLALLAKTSTVMLPVTLLAAIWWQNSRITKLDCQRVAPHFALALAFGLMTVWFQTEHAIGDLSVQSEHFLGRLAGAGFALWFYLSKALLPVNLSMIYPRWEIGSTRIVNFLPLLAWIGMMALAWRFRQSGRRPVLFALSCFTAILFPVLGLFNMYFMVFSRVSDHLAYLAVIAIAAFVGAGISLILNRKISSAVGALLVAALVFLTWQRAKIFASDEALWQDTVAKNPRAWNAHNNLACNLAERGQLDTAMKHFEISLRLNPQNAEAHRNLGRALALKGRFAEAEPHFRAALKLKPADTEALVALAGVLAQQGHPDEAIKHLRTALDIKPEVQTRLQLAPLLATTGKTAEAIAEFRQVIAIQTNSFEALNNLAWILATSPEASARNGNEAVLLAQQACRLTQSQQPIPFGTLAAAYAEAGDFTNAVTAAQTAIDLATATGNTQVEQMNRQLQKLYQSGRAFHTPRPGDAGRKP